MRSVAFALLAAALPVQAAVHHVIATPEMTFEPAELVIRRGDAVVFSNGGGVHNVVADDERFRCAVNCNTNTAPSGLAWSAIVQFREAGEIGYYCEAHGDTQGGMRGLIVVEFADGFEDTP